jgi:TolA-binding protein
MNKFFLFIVLLSINTVANEVSVFGAGDLNAPKPYGLTNTEKHILKNKKELGSIETKVKTVKNTVESIHERIDGLESIYEGDSQKLNASVLKLNKLLEDFEVNQNLTTKNTDDLSKLRLVVNEIFETQEEIQKENNKNLSVLKKALAKLEKSINKINKAYISEKEFRKNMKQFITRAEFDALKKSLGKSSSKKTQAKSASKKVINTKLTANEKKAMLDEAKALFKKDYFTKAIPLFETLLALNYKPATSNYYLGEMWYYRKQYDKAIAYFKTSATLYDKASWMPKLLLHSAISFEKIGDLQNAANFYDTLISLYPESKEAVIANKNLTNIQ